MNENILVVDDNPDSVTIMSSILETRGYKVTVATSGAEALAQIQKGNIDLVLGKGEPVA